MRVRAQQFASKRQPQHAHGHTGQGLREPSRLQDARPKEKHFESSHAARRRGFRTTPHPQRKMRVPTRQCALETKAVRTRVGQLGFDTIQPSQTPHMKGNTHDGFALSPPPRGVRARTASGTTHRTGTTVRARNEGTVPNAAHETLTTAFHCHRPAGLGGRTVLSRTNDTTNGTTVYARNEGSTVRTRALRLGFETTQPSYAPQTQLKTIMSPPRAPVGTGP
eukprot:scaffold45361_cov59-Phaeocystis_antarctica.AAC.3